MSQILSIDVIRNLDHSEHKKAHLLSDPQNSRKSIQRFKGTNTHTHREGWFWSQVRRYDNIAILYEILRVLTDVMELSVHNFFDIRVIYAFFASVFYQSGSDKLHKTQNRSILHFLEFLEDSWGRRIATTKEAFERVVPPSNTWDEQYCKHGQESECFERRKIMFNWKMNWEIREPIITEKEGDAVYSEIQNCKKGCRTVSDSKRTVFYIQKDEAAVYANKKGAEEHLVFVY